MADSHFFRRSSYAAHGMKAGVLRALNQRLSRAVDFRRLRQQKNRSGKMIRSSGRLTGGKRRTVWRCQWLHRGISAYRGPSVVYRWSSRTLTLHRNTSTRSWSASSSLLLRNEPDLERRHLWPTRPRNRRLDASPQKPSNSHPLQYPLQRKSPPLWTSHYVINNFDSR